MPDENTNLTPEQLEMTKLYNSFMRERTDLLKQDLDESAETLFPRLAALGVTNVTVECEGGGDHGEVVSVQLEMEPGRVAPCIDKTDCEGKPIRDVVEDVVCLSLSLDYPGWELNAGSDSTYVLDVANRKVSCKRFFVLEEIDQNGDDDTAGDDGGE